jgi:hypothetical protein
MRPLDDAPGPDELLPDLLADTRARTDRAEVTDALDAIDGALTNNIRPVKGSAMIHTDVYSVGLLRDIKRRRVRYGVRSYLIGYCLKGRRWRAARNYFNGYLAEHEGCHHNCGRGWTKRAAERHVSRLCDRAMSA